jgi:phage shock protein PspC (stress-responsive transcriptional regulator)
LCGGVSGAIANKFGMTRGMVRFLFVLTAIFFVGLPVYAILWAVLPDEIDGSIPLEDTFNKTFNVEMVPIVLMFLFGTVGSSIVSVFGALVAVILAAIIAFFVFSRMVGSRDFENYMRSYDYDKYGKYQNDSRGEPETLFEQGGGLDRNADNAAGSSATDSSLGSEAVGDDTVNYKMNSAFDKVDGKIHDKFEKLDDKLNRTEQKIDAKMDKYKNMYSKDYYREKYAKDKYRGSTRGLAAVFVGVAFLLYGLAIVQKRILIHNAPVSFDFYWLNRQFTVMVNEHFPFLTLLTCVLLLALGVILIIEGVRRKAAPFLAFLAVVAIVMSCAMTVSLYRGKSSIDGECTMIDSGNCYSSDGIVYWHSWDDFGVGITDDSYYRNSYHRSGVHE